MARLWLPERRDHRRAVELPDVTEGSVVRERIEVGAEGLERALPLDHHLALQFRALCCPVLAPGQPPFVSGTSGVGVVLHEVRADWKTEVHGSLA